MKTVIRAFCSLLFICGFSTPALAEYVSASKLNCRDAPNVDAAVITTLDFREFVEVAESSRQWSLIKNRNCWVLTEHLSSILPSVTPTNRLQSRPSNSGRSQNRNSSTPTRNYSGSSCPCSGSNVCVGPRGGRYCITSSGKKRYGV